MNNNTSPYDQRLILRSWIGMQTVSYNESFFSIFLRNIAQKGADLEKN